MARPRQPTDVIKANGRKHLSQKEEAERRRKEAQLLPTGKKPEAVRIVYPHQLPESMKPRFRDYALQLIQLGIYLNAKGSGDADALRDYMIFQQAYLNEMAMKQTAMKQYQIASDDEAKGSAMDAVSKWASLAQKDFAAAKSAAASIGLTVSARCHLIIPQAKDPDQDDDMDDLLGGGKLVNLRRASGG